MRAEKSTIAPTVSEVVGIQHGPCSCNLVLNYRVYNFTFGMEELEGPDMTELPEVFKNKHTAK